MKQSYFTDAKELFTGRYVVRKYTFKTMNIGDSYAHLAVRPILSAIFELLREKSVFFQKSDCFECLSPYNIAA